ncbi:hypothetical protein RQP46_003639 [Phenoliferia psychrophenolica]
MGATIYSLAPELLEKILDNVRDEGLPSTSHDFYPDNKDLLDLLPVCREWADAVQRVLWRDARIMVFQGQRLPTVPTIPVDENGRPRYVIRYLWITFYGKPADDVDTDLVTVWTDAWLAQAPHLQTLCIMTEKDKSGPRWTVLNSPNLSGLRHLNLDYGAYIHGPIGTIPNFAFHLKSLNLAIHPTPPPPELLLPLFSSSRDTLESLDLTIEYAKRQRRQLKTLIEGIKLITSNIKRLDLDIRETPYDHTSLSSQIGDILTLSPFSNLKYLGLWGDVANTESGGFFDILKKLALPATLTHLTIDVETDTDGTGLMKPITEAVRLPALAELQKLRLSRFISRELRATEEGVELIELCAERGIRLHYGQSLSGPKHDFYATVAMEELETNVDIKILLVVMECAGYDTQVFEDWVRDHQK